MKKLAADFIFSGNSAPIKNGVVVLDNNGVVLDLLNPETTTINWEEVEKKEGIICPGFINTHCHLELSYLKNQLSEHTQLHNFIKEITSARDNYTSEERLHAIKLGEQEMIKNGIVAVGDIANGNSTFAIKENSKLKYHTFIEVFGSNPEIANSAFLHAKNIYNQYFDKKRVSITPHATYSVSDNLTQLINAHAVHNDSLISIHNQETASENSYYQEGKGKLFDLLEIAKKTNNTFQATGQNALSSFLSKYKELSKIMLVHNTFTNRQDVEWAKRYTSNIYWCFCPNANLFIENTLPNFNLFLNEKCTIGTDSLASNWSLSILDELKTITKSNPTISLERLIQWATYNGAKFLGFDELGSIERRKSPGLNLIKNIDIQTLSLKQDSFIQILT